MTARASGTLVGIFVGGQSRRMGGVAKGALPAPGGERSLVERLLLVARTAPPPVRVVLVGQATAYEQLGLPCLADEPSGIGPIGGLAALLRQARAELSQRVVALACDLPYVDAELLQRLCSHDLHAAAVAPRPDGIWQPLFARYQPERALPSLERVLSRGQHGLFQVLNELGPSASVLPLRDDDGLKLRDWDRPSDLIA